MPENISKFREQIAEKFVHLLETEQGQWQKTWIDTIGPEAPFNMMSNRHYTGFNLMNLTLDSMAYNYNDPRWVTAGEIFDSKKRDNHPTWHLKKGSRASYVEVPYYYDIKEKKSISTDNYRELVQQVKMGLLEKEKLNDFRLYYKNWKVFNASCVEGIEPYVAKEVKTYDSKSDDLIPNLAKSLHVKLENKESNECYYLPIEDKVVLPYPERFISGQAYDFTALHELTHSTGHPSRLNRNQSGHFGTESYAYEELIAEIGSCLMAAELHVTEIDPKQIENSQAYVQSWISSIKDKPEALMNAIRDAKEATHYMDKQLELYLDKNRAAWNEKSLKKAMNRVGWSLEQKPTSDDKLVFASCGWEMLGKITFESWEEVGIFLEDCIQTIPEGVEKQELQQFVSVENQDRISIVMADPERNTAGTPAWISIVVKKNWLQNYLGDSQPISDSALQDWLCDYNAEECGFIYDKALEEQALVDIIDVSTEQSIYQLIENETQATELAEQLDEYIDREERD